MKVKNTSLYLLPLALGLSITFGLIGYTVGENQSKTTSVSASIVDLPIGWELIATDSTKCTNIVVTSKGFYHKSIDEYIAENNIDGQKIELPTPLIPLGATSSKYILLGDSVNNYNRVIIQTPQEKIYLVEKTLRTEGMKNGVLCNDVNDVIRHIISTLY